MRINPNVRVHTFKKAMAFASTTSKAEQVMKVVVACPQNMPTIYNVFPSFNVMGFVLLQHKKGENFPCGARQINPQKDMKAKLLHFNKIGCMAHMYFPANLLNYHHSISFCPFLPFIVIYPLHLILFGISNMNNSIKK